ncbi:MAG: alanine--tRNA ligase [Tissierellales bacterium]|nr:alanine--tRNA ligase [Tissierellales bacterium]
MKKLGLHDIRKEYLEFFRDKGHLIAPSFSLVPKNDKSLLLIGAGMAPLKPYFTGEKTPPSKRMATCQKCIRTGDIDNVGRTARHATFFEMLGNFSFGDYFKKEAISWAWEFLTERLELDPNDLWVSVYHEDDEAYELWNKMIGIPEDKIVRLGKEDNFWELEVGPSGPCSEIYVDRGQAYGCGKETCKPGCDCDRFLEVWNLVFTQFDKDENGIYHPLPNPNIDTGMGLERIATIMENTDNIFEIGAIKDILNKVLEISGYKYGSDKEKDISVRIITDHIRAITFLVSDGVVPSNEGRGYVLRRLIRRASRHGKLLGIEDTFLDKVADVVINSWMVEYKELKENETQIKKVISIEEEKFKETINQGLNILENMIEELSQNNNKILDGERAFKLYDTFGFPPELTSEILKEKGFEIDLDGFNRCMSDQRERARRAREETDSGWGNKDKDDITVGIKSSFIGYETLMANTIVNAIIKDNNIVEKLVEGESGFIILEETPFYGESGGQVGDKGLIKFENGLAVVEDTKVTPSKTMIHHVVIKNGELKVGDNVFAEVDVNLRESTMRNHSATHLLHKALRNVLGNHVSQAGSLVTPTRLRFDFTHFEPLTKDQIRKIEEIVNNEILKAQEVKTEIMTLRDAQEKGIIGLFEEKYGEYVRVVSIGNFSQELCGGTHVKNSGQIGMFKILSESSVASGVRRIEALTGFNVYQYIYELEENINKIASTVGGNKQNVVEKVSLIIEESKNKELEIKNLRKKLILDSVDDIINKAKTIGNLRLIIHDCEDMSPQEMRELGDIIKSKLNDGVIFLVSRDEDKIVFISMATEKAVELGVNVGVLVKHASNVVGGNGGGRKDLAQGGGKFADKLDDALKEIEILLREQLKI